MADFPGPYENMFAKACTVEKMKDIMKESLTSLAEDWHHVTQGKDTAEMGLAMAFHDLPKPTRDDAIYMINYLAQGQASSHDLEKTLEHSSSINVEQTLNQNSSHEPEHYTGQASSSKTKQIPVEQVSSCGVGKTTLQDSIQ
ncbi:hypothetical protein Pcinc_042737 [Petrolisthes cinctipes]|uniref:Uncharacterized protein n=1 Tax=Petrolisthes cinctipes TaxID=88211 RepID=A0AAE1BH69_PETCI|nr:hypothetical protein Pcinc_042737 [Petrolisthes cinctipes]